MPLNFYSIKDVSTLTDRHNLYILKCKPDELSASIIFLQNQNIPVINLGNELAKYLDALEDYSYLTINAYDFSKKLLDEKKAKLEGIGNDIVAIYNLGILLEPELEINAALFIKEFSKSSALIIIWENENELNEILNWETKKTNYFINLSDIQLKNLQYEI